MIDPKTIEMMEAEWRDRLEHAVQQARINTVSHCIRCLEFHGYDEAIPYIEHMAVSKLGLKA